MVVEEWDESWTVLDAYRGVNANMHAVEALLASGDVGRAERILTRVVHGFARTGDWRIPEHFDTSWTPLPDYHRDQPAHPFRPYGATVGHWFEWSRLTLCPRGARRRGARTGCWRTLARSSTPASARAGRSTVPRLLSTPSTGRVHRWCASGCTGWSARPSPRPPPCTR